LPIFFSTASSFTVTTLGVDIRDEILLVGRPCPKELTGSRIEAPREPSRTEANR